MRLAGTGPLSLPANTPLEQRFPGAGLPGKTGQLQPRGLFDVPGTAGVTDLVARARQLDPSYAPPDHDRYLLLRDVPAADLGPLADALTRDPQVAYAAPAPFPARPPAFVPVATGNPYDWLRPAPDGVGATAVWPTTGDTLLGGTTTIRLLERGVRVLPSGGVDHVDLDPSRIRLAPHADLAIRNSETTEAEREHGLMSCGVMAAGPDPLPAPSGEEAVGIVHLVDSVEIYPIGTQSQTPQEELDRTIAALLHALADASPGEILVVELQTSPSRLETQPDGTTVRVLIPEMLEMPFEVVDWYHHLVRLGSALGLTVVLPAGNGGHDLDAPLIPFSSVPGVIDPNVHDSGSIMVGMAEQLETGWSARFNHTQGTRIDCFAGATSSVDSIGTTGGQGSADTVVQYLGTSAATAVIGGVAAAVQSRVQSGSGLLLAGQMRNLLTHPALTTHTVSGRVGRMPDLALIVPALAMLPDLVVRDHPTDDGSPGPGRSTSPDILVSPATDPPPTSMSGGNPPVDNSIDHQVHVRVHNRGAGAASAPTCRVYWAAPSTLITPSSWSGNLIGTGTFPAIPAGTTTPVVSSAIPWPSAQIPAEGHYCFVGIVEDPDDPAPPIPIDDTHFDWGAWLDFVGSNNNVAWRNFNVVTGTSTGGGASLDFRVEGAPDKRRVFQLELRARVPEGVRLWLDTRGRMISRRQFGDRARELRREPLEVQGAIRLKHARVPRRARWPMSVRVAWPKDLREGSGTVFVRQLWRRREVGRVTWQLEPLEGKQKC